MKSEKEIQDLIEHKESQKKELIKRIGKGIHEEELRAINSFMIINGQIMSLKWMLEKEKDSSIWEIP